MVSLFTRAVQRIEARGYLLFGRRGGRLRRLLVQIAINVERTDGRIKFCLCARAFICDRLSFFGQLLDARLLLVGFGDVARDECASTAESQLRARTTGMTSIAPDRPHGDVIQQQAFSVRPAAP